METKRGLPSLIDPQESQEDAKQELIASDIIQLVGWTPLVELKKIVQKDGIDARIIAKLETYQPLCSVKDRGALSMVEDAENKGLITPGITTLVEPTSGNIGIALACIAAQKGYKFVAVIPANYSIDKRMLLRYLGAEVVLTDPNLSMEEFFARIEQVKSSIPNSYMLNQFTNTANPEAHFTTTGPEIWEDTAGKVDIFVSGAGTGGTISGVGKYLKTKSSSVKIICVEPTESPLISGGKPGKHNIQGISPPLIPDNLDMSCIDEVITVTTKEAMAYARRLAREEGLLVGISSGAYLAACIKVANREENKGKMIVTLFPSGGERYMSTELFDEVRDECINMSYT